MKRYYKLEAGLNVAYFDSLHKIAKLLLKPNMSYVSRDYVYEKMYNNKEFSATVGINNNYNIVLCQVKRVPYYEFNRNRVTGLLLDNNVFATDKYREGQIFPYLQKKETLSNGCMALNNPEFDLVEQKGLDNSITVLSLFELPIESDLIFIKTVDLIKLNHLLGVELSDSKLKMYQQNGRLIELFVGTDLLKVYIQDKLEAGQCRFLYSTYKTNKLNVRYW